MMPAAGYEWRDFFIPHYMGEGLEAYILQGRPVGDFLTAVLSNDLAEACARADQHNLANLPAYIGYLHNEAPVGCYGSREKVKKWIKWHADIRAERARIEADIPPGSPGNDQA